MKFSAMTVSMPLDQLTYDEVKAVCEAATKVDGVHYESVLNLTLAKSYESKGFFVLIYDDEKDCLAGLASAMDMLGLNTYEWSMVVAPMYRQIGIGEAIINVLKDAMQVRGYEGELALTVEGAPNSKEFLMQHGYQYSFSETNLVVEAQVCEQREGLIVEPFVKEHTDALVEIFVGAFGDQPEESLDLIDYNTSTPGIQLWVAKEDNEVVGTVTTRKEGEIQWVTALAVHPKAAGKGIGTAILNWVKQQALCNGEHFISLDVEIDNARALAVYEKAGFSKSSQIDYYVFVG